MPPRERKSITPGLKVWARNSSCLRLSYDSVALSLKKEPALRPLKCQKFVKTRFASLPVASNP